MDGIFNLIQTDFVYVGMNIYQIRKGPNVIKNNSMLLDVLLLIMMVHVLIAMKVSILIHYLLMTNVIVREILFLMMSHLVNVFQIIVYKIARLQLVLLNVSNAAKDMN